MKFNSRSVSCENKEVCGFKPFIRSFINEKLHTPDITARFWTMIVLHDQQARKNGCTLISGNFRLSELSARAREMQTVIEVKAKRLD